MEFKPQHIRDIAAKTMAVLNQLKVSSVEDINSKIGLRHIVESGEIIEFSLMPSNVGTTATTVSYLFPVNDTNDIHLEIPLEFRMNSQLSYASFLLKSNQVIYGYVPFLMDTNIRQSRMFVPGNFLQVFDELKRLVVR